MSSVFEATDVETQEPVAVKVLATAVALDPDVRSRFASEADALGRIEHPHVVRARSTGHTHSGEPYIVLELLEGETLRDRVRRGHVSLQECVRIVDQISSALSAAHAQEIVHRDVKPENIFLTTDSAGDTHATLIDFGIFTEFGARSADSLGEGLVGTPAYMAPEQANGRNDLVDARTDQYALTLVAYEMLTGVRAFAGNGVVDTLKRARDSSPPPASTLNPGLSPEIDDVLGRGLAKSRDARFPDVLEFARRLRDAIGAGEEASADRDEAPSSEDEVRDLTMPSSVPSSGNVSVPPRSGTRSRRARAA